MFRWPITIERRERPLRRRIWLRVVLAVPAVVMLLLLVLSLVYEPPPRRIEVTNVTLEPVEVQIR